MELEYPATLIMNRNEALPECIQNQQVGRGRQVTDRCRNSPSIKNLFDGFQIDLAK